MEVQISPTRSWVYPTVILCAYGFFKEMKPSESFLTPYLNSTFKHLDDKDIQDQIYPVSTYSYLFFLFLVFLLTDLLRYKPLIVLESLAYLSTRLILIWGNGILIMQIMQVTYGFASATEIAYYSYIYVMVDQSHYQRVTSYTRAATLLGKGLSDIIGQVFISTKVANYLQLNYVSLVSVSIAVVISFFLPRVHNNIFSLDENVYQVFDNSVEENSEDVSVRNDTLNSNDRSNISCCLLRCRTTFQKMWIAFKTSYKNKFLLMWSVWWAFSMCGGLQVEDYVMNLWSHITGPNTKDLYNGAVFACGTLLSAVVVFLYSFVQIQLKGIVSEVLISGISVMNFVLLLLMSRTSNIWVAYGCYVVFRASYAFVLTIASYQIALHVKMSGYALIFGWNTFLALCCQSLLTFIVTDKKGLDLNITQQFFVYSCYFVIIGVMFSIRPICKCFYYLFTRCCCCHHAVSDVI